MSSDDDVDIFDNCASDVRVRDTYSEQKCSMLIVATLMLRSCRLWLQCAAPLIVAWLGHARITGRGGRRTPRWPTRGARRDVDDARWMDVDAGDAAVR